MTSVATWCEAEFARMDLGDTRLERRAVQIAQEMAARPSADLPSSVGGWTALRATYRLFKNARVHAAEIRRVHAASAVRRGRGHSTLLAIQDTTELDFTGHKRMQGLGPVGTSRKELSAQQGVEVHSTLLLSSAGEPLGLLGQLLWARDPAQLGKGRDCRKRPIQEKESNCWLLGVQEADQRVPRKHRLVHIGDIGADIWELFAMPRRADSHLLVRLEYNRTLEQPADPETGRPWHLFEAVESAPVCGQMDVTVRDPRTRHPRTAHLHVRYAQVTLACPVRLRARYPDVRVQVRVILSQEQDAPPNVKPVRWLLLTTLPLRGFASARRCVDWYALRWLIERYHFVLKSGLGIERLQLQSVEQMERALALCSVVAWRLLALTYQARLCPDAPASGVLEDYEWQALCCVTQQVPVPPQQPPSLAEAVLWIAKLGGFLARKGDGPPGVKTLWRGLARLHDIATTWRFAQNALRCG